MRARLGTSADTPAGFVREWFAPRAAAELLHFRALIEGRRSEDVLRVVLARAARSARLTTHFDLDFPRVPHASSTGGHKRRRTCRPVDEARKFLTRYLADTAERIRAFASVRDPRRAALVLHGDARELELGGPYDGVITSPPLARARGALRRGRPSASSSTTAESSIRRSSRAPGCGSTSGSSGT